MACRMEITSRAPAPIRCKFLHQVLHRRTFLQIDAIDGLVLRLDRRLLHHLCRSRGQRSRLRDLCLRDHVDREAAMQDRNWLQAHHAPDNHGSGALIDHDTGARINLDFDALDLVEKGRDIFVRSVERPRRACCRRRVRALSREFD